jgi:hypothetical protein
VLPCNKLSWNAPSFALTAHQGLSGISEARETGATPAYTFLSSPTGQLLLGQPRLFPALPALSQRQVGHGGSVARTVCWVCFCMGLFTGHLTHSDGKKISWWLGEGLWGDNY